MRIFIATGNPHKVSEIRDIIEPLNAEGQIELHSIAGLNIAEPEEPFSTFIDNACHKARYYGNLIKEPVLSEDSGLCVEALDGFPGVYTKNFVEECGGIENAYVRLEELLKDKDNYRAHFNSIAVLYFPDSKKIFTSEGKVFGTITFPPRGNEGFAFDPIFIPDGYDRVMAELGQRIKNQIGHRGIAVRDLLKNSFHI